MVMSDKRVNTLSMDYYHQLHFAAAKSHCKFLYDTNMDADLSVTKNLQNLFGIDDEL